MGVGTDVVAVAVAVAAAGATPVTPTASPAEVEEPATGCSASSSDRAFDHRLEFLQDLSFFSPGAPAPPFAVALTPLAVLSTRLRLFRMVTAGLTRFIKLLRTDDRLSVLGLGRSLPKFASASNPSSTAGEGADVVGVVGAEGCGCGTCAPLCVSWGAVLRDAS